MKKLFQLRDLRTNKSIPNIFFPDKTKAKAERDRLNEEAGARHFVVTPGPDHWKFRQ